MNITPELIEALGIKREDVLEKASRMLLKEALVGHEYDPEDGEHYEVDLTETIKEKITAHINTEAENIVKELFNKKVVNAIESYLGTLTFQETNYLGEPKGEARTLKEVAIQSVSNVLEKKVDSNGKTDNSYGTKDRTYAEWLLENLTKEYLRHAITVALGDSGKMIGKILNTTITTKASEIEKAVMKAVDGVSKF